MSRWNLQDTHSSPGTPQSLGQVAAAVAAGTVIGTRSRMGGALLLAGLAWLAFRYRPTSGTLHPHPEADLPIDDPPPALDINDICAPSNPFLDESSGEEKWEELRAALIPPPSLFIPPAPVAVSAPSSPPLESSLPHSAPVYREVDENIPARSVHLSSVKAALPDTISIPTTPDPPPDLWVDSITSKNGMIVTNAIPVSPPAVVPKAGLRPQIQPVAGESLDVSDTGPTKTAPPAPKKRKSFLEWMRE